MDRVEQRMLAVVALLVTLTAVGLWALWPREQAAPPGEAAPLHAGVIRSAEDYACPQRSPDDPFPRLRSGPCQRVTVEVVEGPDAGLTFEIDTGEEDYPAFETGDRVRVAVSSVEGGRTTYYVADFARLRPLLLLFAMFVATVVAVGRWHGLRSLLGLGLSLAIVVWFVVPAILAGRNPFAVAVVGAFAIMVVTLYLAHGLTVKTTSALIGTAAALGLTAGLGLLFVAATNLTGLSSEEASLARFAVEGLDLRGLILAGLVIGALGVLDDVTVSQASTVFAVHEANPDQSFGQVFRLAMAVGRDHIASTVNTLVLAYVGASIALIVLFSTGGSDLGEIVNTEVVAGEIVTTLVGSLGLISAVPLTTALATTVALRRRPADRPVPHHLRAEVDETELTDEELAHRRWVEYLRSGAGAEGGVVPHVPTDLDDG